MGMRRWSTGLLVLAVTLAACEDTQVFVPVDGEPAPPRALAGSYYARAVTLSWELHPQWDGESFRVYGKRDTDGEFFLIADVTSCSDGVCSYTDTNVVADQTYLYYVTAVDPDTGTETASDFQVEVYVPVPDPPPAPGGAEVVALDGALYLRWGAQARSADDFSFYRVYLEDQEGTFLLGETDSEGFLDELVVNGVTNSYFVTAVDDQGHESGGSALASGTPRPDYNGEAIWAFEDRPDAAGFLFQDSEAVDPIVQGSDPGRHFRLEVDGEGWWLVPGASTEVYREGIATTALRCGPGADAGCVDVVRASTSGADYTVADVGLLPQTSYVLRYRASDGRWRYAVIRVTLQGFDQNGDALMIFDWAHQLQPDNPDLSTVPVELTAS